jgi:hypothetical protein
MPNGIHPRVDPFFNFHSVIHRITLVEQIRARISVISGQYPISFYKREFRAQNWPALRQYPSPSTESAILQLCRHRNVAFPTFQIKSRWRFCASRARSSIDAEKSRARPDFHARLRAIREPHSTKRTFIERLTAGADPGPPPQSDRRAI